VSNSEDAAGLQRDRRSRARPRDRVIAGLGLLLVGLMSFERLAALSHAAPSDFDDAYTYLRYAQHWLAGQGVAWNPGEGPVYGMTSVLHLFVVTAIRWAFPALPMWQVLQAASGAAAIGLLAALVAIAALATRSPRICRNWSFWSAAILALVAFRETFVFHAGTGMDTMLSAVANAVLIFFSLQLAAKPSVGRMALAVLAALLAVLARPDNLACAALCPTLAIALLAPGPRARPAAIYAVAFTAALAVLALGLVHWLGSPVPLSFFVKQPFYYGGFAGEFTWNPFRFLGVFLGSAWPFLAILILFCDRAGARRAVVLLAPAILTIAVLFHFNQIMGHLGRFFYPLLPFFVVAGVLEFDAWLVRIRAGKLQPKVLLVRASIALAIVLVGRSGLDAGADWYQARADEQKLAQVGGYHVPATTPLPDLDSWEAARAIAAIAAAAPTGCIFAMSEHGLPGALAPRITIIDVLGLHDPIFARQGFSAAELFRRRPDFIWLPHSDHTQMLREILGSNQLWTAYDFYPDAFFHGIAIRKGGPHAARLAELVRSAWQVAYPGVAMADYRAQRGE